MPGRKRADMMKGLHIFKVSLAFEVLFEAREPFDEKELRSLAMEYAAKEIECNGFETADRAESPISEVTRPEEIPEGWRGMTSCVWGPETDCGMPAKTLLEWIAEDKAEAEG